MIASVFTIYFLAMFAIWRKKKRLAIALIVLAMLFTMFIFKFHATDTLGIGL